MLSPGGDGLVVPPGLCAPLHRLAVIGKQVVQRDSGGLPLVPGIEGLLAELAAIASDGACSTVGASHLHRVPQGERWLSVGDASAVTGLSTVRVRELARGGSIIAVKFGRAWMIDADSIRSYRRRRVV